ncbi:MAG: signal peptidase I [Gemmatimonadota bacterium]|nr:MAG: signal peptidase I [Gemmatimonadota bacterium]
MAGTVSHDEEQRSADVASEKRGVVRLFWEWTRSIIMAFVLFVVVRTFVIEAFKIPTGSMEGTLLIGDFLLVNKMVYGAEVPGLGLRLPPIAEPERGDIIVFDPPHDPGRNYVKRVIGVAGDTLRMVNKILYVNGDEIAEPYAKYIDRSGSDAIHPDMQWQERYLVTPLVWRQGQRPYLASRDNWGPILVPRGKFFVLGDNRDNSEDSRYWGFVDREAIHGRPWFVYYSFDRLAPTPAPWLAGVRWQRIGDRIR